MSNSATENREIAERQIGLFEEQFSEQYDEEYAAVLLEYACHAAFPLTLTTELAYLLRQRLQEKYGIDLPWTAAPELLLSSLCDAIGSDLYSMGGELRRVLLERLAKYYGADRIEDLGLWMASYIKYRIQVDKRLRAQILGEPTEWIALAWLKRNDRTTNEIKQYFRELIRKSDYLEDIIRWSSMDGNKPDMLTDTGLSPLEQSDLMAAIDDLLSKDNESIEFDRIRTSIAKAGFPLLQSKTIEYATISFEETAINSGDALYPCEFETVQVNKRGDIVEREQYRSLAFREPLAPEIGLEMVAIPSSKFMMGSPESEHDRYDDESPQHQVIVSPFFIGKYPITQAQWGAIANTPEIQQKLNPDPSYFKGDNLPVENVSWKDAIEFCQRLSRQTGRDYRLPTEAEWEYACRAGTNTPFYFGKTITGKLANYDSGITYLQERKVKSTGETTSVGVFPPNQFGLYDMHGNVWEWCLDHWHGNYQGAPTDGSAWLSRDTNNHLRRGGSWLNSPRDCHFATRVGDHSVNRDGNIGFRVVCEIHRT
jgi:formylglycine-generating enzyme required for sulfatase activity